MSNYLSSILTSTTSRYTSLRRSLLPDENDGDTEDDSHISRVLRAYYVEKGRSFPPWLPPDPNSRQAPTQQYSQPNRPPILSTPSRGLSDLWDKPSQRTEQQTPQSLRRSSASTQRVPPMQPAAGNPYDGGGSSQRLQPGGSRPMLGARDGSMQSLSQQTSRQLSQRTDEPLSLQLTLGGGAGTTAQERLKARLWGGGRSSSGGSGGSQGPGTQMARGNGSSSNG